jgi:hypothetical protein
MNIIARALTIIESEAPRCGTVRVHAGESGAAPVWPAGGVFGEARPVLLHGRPS